MQVVIALPAAEEFGRLDTPVCGVAVLTRVIATALRSGGTRFLVVGPPGTSEWLAPRLQSPAIRSGCFETLEVAFPFDPGKPEHWSAIARRLDERFLWMPCDYLAHKEALAQLLAAATAHPDAAVRFSGVADSGPDKGIFERPTVLLRSDQAQGRNTEFEIVAAERQPGVSVRYTGAASLAESALIRCSGKPTDGIYSRFNRRLCWPALRWLSHTRAIPNEVTFGGLAVAVLAGYCFALGSWAFDVAGAVLFLISGLFDETDGMLARLKFQESPYGCWLETMVDYTTYLLIFAGMTIGGYRRGGEAYLYVGAALLFGSVVSFIAISVQRRLAAPAGKPSEYSQRYLAALERDSGNPISRMVRQLQFLTRKGVLVHYLLLFAVLGLLPLFLFLSAFGANVAWVVTLYFTRRLFLSNRHRVPGAPSRNDVPVEVEK